MGPGTIWIHIMIGTILFGDSYRQWGWGSTRNLVRCWKGIILIGMSFRIFTIKAKFRYIPLTGIEPLQVLFLNCLVYTLSEKVLNCLKSTGSVISHPMSTKQMPLNSNLPFPKDTNPFRSLKTNLSFLLNVQEAQFNSKTTKKHSYKHSKKWTWPTSPLSKGCHKYSIFQHWTSQLYTDSMIQWRSIDF